ncbi:hypothetical protein [Formosa sp. 4Alg 33]|uniref:hypothetical protein n=1 Tax=Formosa sp. 4Alg 33 TaxID=3382189 RepID=UPI003D9C5571
MTEQYGPYENTIIERLNDIFKQGFAIAKHNIDLKLKTNLNRNAIKIFNYNRPSLPNTILTPT